MNIIMCVSAWKLINFLLIICVASTHSEGWGMIYRIKQVRDILESNQPTDPHEPKDYLLVETSPESNRGVQPNPFSHLGNKTDFSQFPGNYWHESLANSINVSPQLTASMQRQLLPNQVYPPSQSALNYYSQDTEQWNQSFSKLIDKALQGHETGLSSIEATNNQPTSGVSEDFVGPDGKLKMTICDHPYGFLRRQKKLCRRYLHLMDSVVRGFFMGLKECEYRFSNHRWNCQGYNLILKMLPKQRLRNRQSRNSSSNPARMKTYLDKLLSKGTKESAYVMAVTSAGVSHAVTKACSSGMHENCGCDRTIYDHPREPNFEWSGCSDNIHFGAAFSRQFLDVRERSRIRRRPKLAMTNLHNNHVGRQAVINKMEVQCKCHGVSGSCEMRTCWRSLPKFRDLGAHLQELFHQAILVDYVDQQLVRIPDNEMGDGLSRITGNLRTRSLTLLPPVSQPSSDRLGPPTENDLLYITRSPTFCHHDPGYGSLGTYGRKCSEDPKANNSCDYLCCGRGFKRETFVQEERCNCKFQWCCKVICQTCRKTVVVSTCN